MLIESQDRESLFMFGANTYITISRATKCSVIAVTRDDEFDLGLYTTARQAIKVIGMIEDAYDESRRVFEMPADGEV